MKPWKKTIELKRSKRGGVRKVLSVCINEGFYHVAKYQLNGLGVIAKYRCKQFDHYSDALAWYALA